jgi:hypothetical protein
VFHVRYERLRIARPVVLTAVAIAAAYALPSGTGFESWGTRLALAVAWPFALFATGFVSGPERERIVRLLRNAFRRGDGSGPEAMA